MGNSYSESPKIFRGREVLLERGVSVTITDIPESRHEALLVGEDETGKLYVFPEWEIVND